VRQPAKVGERAAVSTARGQLLPKRKGGCAGREPPEREGPWTWQRDEISLQARVRRKTSKGCESLRTERSDGVGVVAARWLRTGDVAKRAENPGR